MLKKLKSKNGGLKELLYDNMGIFIVGILIVVTIFAFSNQISIRGGNNMSNITKIEEKIGDKDFTSPNGLD